MNITSFDDMEVVDIYGVDGRPFCFTAICGGSNSYIFILADDMDEHEIWVCSPIDDETVISLRENKISLIEIIKVISASDHIVKIQKPLDDPV